VIYSYGQRYLVLHFVGNQTCPVQFFLVLRTLIVVTFSLGCRIKKYHLSLYPLILTNNSTFTIIVFFFCYAALLFVFRNSSSSWCTSFTAGVDGLSLFTMVCCVIQRDFRSLNRAVEKYRSFLIQFL